MERVFKTAVIGIVSFALSAAALPAQSAYAQGEGRYQTVDWHDGDRDRQDRDRDRRDHDRDRGWDRDRGRDYRGDGHVNGYYDRGYVQPSYVQPGYVQPGYVQPYRGGYYYSESHDGRTAALTIGGAAAGAVIGGAAGRGQGAALGAVIGGVAGFVAGQSTRHNDYR